MSTRTDTERRSRLRARVGVAARVLPPAWPVQRFVAVNPLTGLEELPVELAVDTADRLRGGALSLSEARFRELHASGRITDPDLIETIVARHPEVRATGTVRIAGIDIDPAELVRLDLVAGPLAPEPAAVPITRSEWVDHAEGSDLAGHIDEYVSRWMACFLDDGAAWPMPGREAGLYPAWKRLAPRDPGLGRLAGPSARQFIAALPPRADDALLELTVLLAAEPHGHIEYFQRHLCRQAGWAGALAGPGGAHPDRLVDYLAVRLAVEAAVVERGDRRRVADRATTRGPNVPAIPDDDLRARCVLDAGVSSVNAGPSTVSLPMLSAVRDVIAVVPISERQHIWQAAYERNYRVGLVGSLASTPTSERLNSQRPSVTTVFCIDPRSEGMRRHLEAELGDDVETIGYAGFFGLPVAVSVLDAGDAQASCPVIVTPRAIIAELPAGEELGVHDHGRRHGDGRNLSDSLSDVWKEAKSHTGTKFSLAETAGWMLGPLAALATFAPSTHRRLVAATSRAAVPPVVTRMGVTRREPDSVELSASEDRSRGAGAESGMFLADQVATAHAILATLGRERPFGRLVLLCGHGSHHVNNPFRSALDCGACGGRAGGANARTAATLLNLAAVRTALLESGTDLGDTVFVAGEHHTTTDVVELLDAEDVPPTHRVELDALASALDHAGGALALERSATLVQPLASRHRTASVSRVRTRADDWAQVAPEWGLANNAAFVVGPRSLTTGVDLGRRVFLHSYRTAADDTGGVLEAILTGPMVVAHWISSQYYASTVDPATYGAGSKPLHNVVGDLGVLEGSGGDLRPGLPVESVSVRGVTMHEPMRLLLIVDAPRQHVEMVIGRNPVLTRLFDNGWVTIVARSGSAGPDSLALDTFGLDSSTWRRRTRSGDWVPEHEDTHTVTPAPAEPTVRQQQTAEVVA